MNLLVVENDRSLLAMLETILTPRYMMTCAESCKHAGDLLEIQPFDLILLDIQLPDGSGFDFCRSLKNRPHPPILMLTVFDDEASTLKGFASGADDYVTKPFSIRILLARMEALLRRSGKSAILQSGDLVFDMNRHCVKRAGQEIHLLPTEYSLAELLIRQRGALITRQTLLARLWDDRNLFVEENTLTVNISRLRKKLGSWRGQPYIVTQRSYGYRWGVEVEDVHGEQ